MKSKFKTYSFWMSVCAAVVLLLNNLGNAFGFSFDNEVFTAIVDSVCGVLVVFGILTMSKNDKEDDENKIEQQNTDDDKIEQDDKKM